MWWSQPLGLIVTLCLLGDSIFYSSKNIHHCGFDLYTCVSDTECFSKYLLTTCIFFLSYTCFECPVWLIMLSFNFYMLYSINSFTLLYLIVCRDECSKIINGVGCVKLITWTTWIRLQILSLITCVTLGKLLPLSLSLSDIGILKIDMVKTTLT